MNELLHNGMLVFIAVILASIFNCMMDRISSRYDLTLFKKIKSRRFQQWANPNLSWINKKSSNKFIQFCLSTFLVMFTDLWHALKFLFLNCFFVVFAIYTIDHIPFWINIIYMNIIWGFIFNIIYSFDYRK